MDSASNRERHPHEGQPVLAAGPELEQAEGVMICLHGRGASAEDILAVYPILGVDRIAAVAPEAAGQTWYPYSFLAPLESNQPYLDSALRLIDSIVEDVLGHGVPIERIALFGFSQGACLTCEFVARNPRRYGAVMALTGGIIGPPGTPRDYAGDLAGTPIFLGTSDPDPHVPFARVEETRDVLSGMGASVEVRRYPGMPHTINEDELEACGALLRKMTISAGKCDT